MNLFPWDNLPLFKKICIIMQTCYFMGEAKKISPK